MMVVLPLQHPHMQRDSRGLAKTLQSMMDHLRTELADLLVFEAEVANEEGSGGNVEDGAGECFVEGCVGVAEACDAFAVTECEGEGAA